MTDTSRPLVLVAEDDLDTRRILTTRLTRELQLEVVEVGDGAAALDFLGERVPDLVCVDLALPIISGYEVCRRIRSGDRTHAVPILVVTGRDSLEDLAWAHEVGVDAFLSKPFKARVFVHNVQRLLAGRLEGGVRVAS